MLRHIPQPLLTLLLILLSLPTSTTAQSSSADSSSIVPTPSPSPPPYPNNATTSTPPSNSTSSITKPALATGDTSGTIYVYLGCFNESAGLPGTTGLRSLDGISEGLPGVMTVPKCLEFCAWGDRAHGAYKLAGLEYARECWCGDELNPLTVPLDDAACDFACDGDNATACGGSLRLSVYNATRGVPKKNGAAARGGGAWGDVVLAIMALGFGIALAGL
ncbi:WSC domain-containing protein [Nemania sp. FL0916]|nr:WSC domain-containing protein [Nemania sp. FL0916]